MFVLLHWLFSVDSKYIWISFAFITFSQKSNYFYFYWIIILLFMASIISFIPVNFTFIFEMIFFLLLICSCVCQGHC